MEMIEVNLTTWRIFSIVLSIFVGVVSGMSGYIFTKYQLSQTPSITMEVQKSNSLIYLTGTVIEKPWSKTTESWIAGDGNYYVLDIGDLEIEKRSAEEGVILHVSEAIAFENFAEYVGKTVEAKGEYVDSKPYQPKSAYGSYPMGMDGIPLPRGAGFKVYEIKVLNE
ncbi:MULTISPECIES: hypothetical protein [Okeania]|uniref:Uncharacterized protein n=1 Tax=Okeania hirsuta TaxID=1458930 RepID=A0A3N6QWI2_9CYAN|nr:MULTISPECIES: hypothetical protein [Okeania]NET79184.1 hypothetical protein [Okeania sp. SIO1F9]RQH17088.1 hypothetical protein D4Z78_18350 [Okeania hirsuta]RQH42995.1 hypothetical protein D5R40_13975 [Okeania hirsuta]